MTSKECLDRIIFEAKMEKPIFSMYYQEFLQPIEQDLEDLEKLKKENQELKEKINHFEKIIEEIKNLPDCDFKNNLLNNIGFKHMFDNCKLTPLPKIPELEKLKK